MRLDRHRSRWRWPYWLGLGLLLLVFGVRAGIATQPAREWLRGRINAALDGTFQGSVEVTRLGGLGSTGVTGVDASIRDPEGNRVIRALGLEVRCSVPALVWQLVASDAPDLVLDEVSLDHAEVWVRDEGEGVPTLAQAFLPAEATVPEADAGGPTLKIRHIRLGSAWVHGRLGGMQIDADVRSMEASLSRSQQSGLTLDVERGELMARALPLEIEPQAHTSVRLRVPAEDVEPLELQIGLEGRVAGSSFGARALLLDDWLEAEIELDGLPASFVNRQVPGLALHGTWGVLTSLKGELPSLDIALEATGSAGRLSVAGDVLLGDPFGAWLDLEGEMLDLARIVGGAPTSDLSPSGPSFSAGQATRSSPQT
jgi:hypothetical protein